MSKQTINYDHLYKFREVNTLSLTNLANTSLWFAKLSSFNDPFEGCYDKEKALKEITTAKCIDFARKSLLSEHDNIPEDTLSNTITNAFIKKGEQEFIKEQKGVMEAILDDMLNHIHENYGFLSLSSDVPSEKKEFAYINSNIANLHMWSLYADGLRGFCIRFNAEKLYESLQEKNPEDTFFRTPVRYDYIPPTPRLADKGEPFVFDIESILEIMNSKHEIFLNEVEYRISSTSSGVKYFSPDCVEEIFIGDKMPKDQINLLLLIIKQKYPDTKITRIKNHPNQYGVFPVPFNTDELNKI